MWSVIAKYLKKALRIGAAIAPDIASAYNPLLGVLVQRVSDAVLNAEALGGPGNGATKWDVALSITGAALPEIERVFAAAGKPVKNRELFMRGIAKLQDGIVDVYNSTGEGAKLPVVEAAKAA
ncbi:MAG: hypothetical protein LLG20_18580 [Acidobacteriales bacterium]|nr:hypothetical protein [Terriglobales bacterium]